MDSGFYIVDLRSQPQWLEPVACWHHQEWLKGRSNALELDEQQYSLDRRVTILQAHLGQEPIPSTFVACVEGEPVGSASVVYYEFTAGKRSEWLTNVYVQPAWRRRGIACRLVRHVCEYAAKQGVASIRLYTRDQCRYYERLGWQTVGKAVLNGNTVGILSLSLT